MNTKAFLLSIIIILFSLIIYLFFQFIPKKIYILTFDEVIKLAKQKSNLIKEINLTYNVNLTFSGKKAFGELNYFKNKTVKKIQLSNEIKNYSNYLNLEIFSLINKSKRKDYSGELNVFNRSCWSIIIEPNETYIACLDEKLGYPLFVYKGKENHAEIFIKNISYS